MNNEPILEQCESGHSFYKLTDHPKNSMGHASCPYCLSIGREVLKAEIEALKAECKRLSQWLVQVGENK